LGALNFHAGKNARLQASLWLLTQLREPLLAIAVQVAPLSWLYQIRPLDRAAAMYLPDASIATELQEPE
jgi:hypothetical protein